MGGGGVRLPPRQLICGCELLMISAKKKKKKEQISTNKHLSREPDSGCGT